MGNALLDRIKAQYEAKLEKSETIMCQWMVDTLQITMHEKFGWGYDRLMTLDQEWRETRKKYKAAMNPDDHKKNNADWVQEKMDAVMRDICKNHQEVIPFEERYPELKKIRYDKR